MEERHASICRLWHVLVEVRVLHYADVKNIDIINENTNVYTKQGWQLWFIQLLACLCLLNAEITTEVCTCLNNKCTFQWKSQVPMMREWCSIFWIHCLELIHLSAASEYTSILIYKFWPLKSTPACWRLRSSLGNTTENVGPSRTPIILLSIFVY